MKVLLCMFDVAESEYCKEQVMLLAKKSGIKLSLEMRNQEQEIIFMLEELLETDLIYIGIHEPEKNGMELAKKLRESGVVADIVFFTRDKSRITEAFDVEALHYLVPDEIGAQKFEQVFQKAVARSKRRRSDTIRFSCAGEHIRIAISEIIYFEVNNRIITVHYQDSAFEFYSTLARVEETLSGHHFIRIHRSLLVAEESIMRIKENTVVMSNGTKLPVGRQYGSNLNSLIGTKVNI